MKVVELECETICEIVSENGEMVRVERAFAKDGRPSVFDLSITESIGLDDRIAYAILTKNQWRLLHIASAHVLKQMEAE